MEISIPPKFKKIIERDNALFGALLINNNNFSQWMSENRLEFFPEYTDHGIAHVNCVLSTAEEIISPMSFDVLTPNDIYVLCTAILLHDCAMHINREGLWNLLTHNSYNELMLGFNVDMTWEDKWNEFKQQVKRFGDSDWNSFFGEFRQVDIPSIDAKSLDDNQKVIIGDFIRQHHAAIAQIISSIGIPTKNGPFKILSSHYGHLNQLAGFIARSHNHALRFATDLIGDNNKRTHRDTHPAYLMGVIRIADYMQFKANRTPKILFSTKSFCSPISIREWKKHLSIISTNNSHPDEELLFIEAFPEDPITLNSIKTLLSGFQREIDDCWSIFGEVYSRYPSLKNLGIIYRRIKSNIDNPDDYVLKNHKKYYHETLSIKSDNQKLFPLLIKPLYGDTPQIGLRELLQNAIDACNERYSLEEKDNVTRKNIPYSISITLDYDANTLVISDDGIGMDINTVRDYFLKVGASYRTSEVWKANFSDNEHSYIPRTGKFGIGMLAGFLIGNEISVQSKHISDKSRGVQFSYTLESSDIAVSFFNSDKVGTSIEISTTDSILALLHESFKTSFPSRIYGHSYYHGRSNSISSNWYFLDTPQIQVFEKSDGHIKALKRTNKKAKGDIFKNWVCVNKTELDGYYWNFSTRCNHVYCNGIIIHEASTPKFNLDVGIESITLSGIEVLLLDNDGIVPINLQRNNFLDEHFFEYENLKSSVFTEYTKRVYNNSSNYTFESQSILNIISKIRRITQSSFIPVIFSEKKMHPSIDRECLHKKIVVDFKHDRGNRGVIFNNNCFNEIKNNNLSYMAYDDCIKDVNTVAMAFNNLLIHKTSGNGNANRSYNDMVHWADRTYISDSNAVLESIIFIKKFDLHKYYPKNSKDLTLKFDNEHTFIITPINEEWYWVSNYEATEDDLSIGIEIINNEPNAFVFAIIKPIEIKSENLFVHLWNKSHVE
ncbi:TPA: HD domain-containing protein [Aeromonas veronii]